jgi:hypothetical protein
MTRDEFINAIQAKGWEGKTATNWADKFEKDAIELGLPVEDFYIEFLDDEDTVIDPAPGDCM